MDAGQGYLWQYGRKGMESRSIANPSFPASERRHKLQHLTDLRQSVKPNTIVLTPPIVPWGCICYCSASADLDTTV